MTSFAFSCLCHHRGVSGYAGTPSFPAAEAYKEHRVLVRRNGGPIVPPPPDPWDLAGKYGVQAPAKDFEATLLGANPTPGDSTLGTLSQDRCLRSESYARWWNTGSLSEGTADPSFHPHQAILTR